VTSQIMHDLEQSFLARGIKRGGVLMFDAPNTVAFIEAARQQQVPILGIDSFIVTETITQPVMEHTLDLSVGALPIDTWTAAQRFVRERHNLGLMFEVVLGDS